MNFGIPYAQITVFSLIQHTKPVNITLSILLHQDPRILI